MAQRPGFDLSRLSTASKILMGAGLLYFIDLFLPWQHACVSFGPASFCGSRTGWHGWGLIAGILVILVLLMEGITLANVEVNMGTPMMRNQIEAGIAGGVLLFSIIKIIADHRSFYFWGWIGLVLAVIIAYGGYMRWTEASVTTPPPAPPSGGGFAP